MKKVTMTNAEVRGLLEALNGLTGAELPLSPRIWFKLTANRRHLIDLSKIMEDGRLKLIEQHAEDKDGVKEVPESKMAAFTKDYNDLLSVEVDLEFIPIAIGDLEKDVNKLKGVPNLYLIFEYIIEDGTTNRKPAKSSKKK